MSDLSTFADYLRAQDRAEATVQGYLADLRAFAAWFEQH
ncbi:MAG: recombinase, partial [Chloroflexi bacterium]